MIVEVVQLLSVVVCVDDSVHGRWWYTGVGRGQRSDVWSWRNERRWRHGWRLLQPSVNRWRHRWRQL